MVPGSFPADISSRIRAAAKLYEKCRICERKCGVNRLKGERGFCGSGASANVFAEYLNYCMEPGLIPSYSIFFSGCNFRCAYCVTHEHVFGTQTGRALAAEELAGIIRAGAASPARSVNFVGGLPDIHLLSVLEAFSIAGVKPPVSWNSNMFMSPEVIPLLDGIVDWYIADLRYGNDACAEKYSGVADYTRHVRRNLISIARMSSSRLIVRFLLLPGHFKCCYEPSVRWLASEINGGTVSFLPRYQPAHEAGRMADICRVTPECEIQEASRLASRLGLRVKETKKETAPFSGKGVCPLFPFSTDITIDKSGRVTFKHLNRDMAEIAKVLASGRM